MKIVVIGAGSWGTSVAVHLDRLGHEVTLGCRRAEQAAALNRWRVNAEHLAGVDLGKISVCDYLHLPAATDVAVVGLPSHTIAEALKTITLKAPVWVSLAKGVMLDTLTTPCEAIETLKPFARVWSLSGPTHAETMAKNLPCAMVLSGAGDLAPYQKAFSGPTVRVYTAADRRGAELGGALKNAYAVAAGVCDGLHLGDNAKAALLTRALCEMERLGVHLGGGGETFYGLTGAGDLMATAYGQWSRNRQLGERVAKGEKAAAVIEAGLTAEGYRASLALRALVRQKQLEAPILEAVAAVLHENLSPLEAMKQLMLRPLKGE